MMRRSIIWIWVTALLLAMALSASAQSKTENIILITSDGARSQEIFGGLDLDVLKSITERGSFKDTPLYKKYGAETPERRREKLMPFFWSVLMRQYGSIAGDRSLGSTVQITNKHRFSYPGYSEILTGQAHDDVIDSNDKKRIPYTTVLEYLKRKLQLTTPQVAAFASSDTLDWIVESKVGTITSNAGSEAYEHSDPVIQQLSRLQFETLTPWDGARYDAYTFRFAMAHLKSFHPRVLFIALDGTDSWAHDGRYDRVLQSLENADNYLRELWGFLQSQEQYKDKTTIIVTTDHGRGSGINGQWKEHGKGIDGSQYIWLAIVSPDSQLRGEWIDAETIYQNQIAATICRFLHINYSENNPEAGKPIERLFVNNNR